jgi:archaellum component FlaC
MPNKLTQSEVENYLSSNGCRLIGEYVNSKEKIKIKCICGHYRTSVLSHIKIWKQFNCKDCTPNRLINSNKNAMQPKTMTAIARKMENLYERTKKYRNDYRPENYNQEFTCWECGCTKNRKNFPYRIQYAFQKEKRCKTCSRENNVKRRKNHSIEQIIQEMITSAKHTGKRRENNGRSECGVIDLSVEFILALRDAQSNKCALSNRELGWGVSALYHTKSSIDRIDSNLGYVRDNVQLVCAYANIAKSDMTDGEFKTFVQEVYNKEPSYTSKECDIPDTKYIRKLVKTSKSSSKKRGNSGRTDASENTITVEDVIAKSVSQNHKCCYTGHNLWNSKERPSIDRIDSNFGYVPSNIQLVTFKANVAKNDMTHEEFMELVNDVHEHLHNVEVRNL